MTEAPKVPKTVLESLLFDDQEERVKVVAGLAYGASHGARELLRTLFEAEEALAVNPARAMELLREAQEQAKNLHCTYHGNLMSLVRYAERNRPVTAGLTH